MNNQLKGIVCGIIAAVSYGTNPLFSLNLYSLGLTPESVLFYRFTLAALFLGIALVVGGTRLGVERRDILLLLGAGVVFALSSEMLYVSFLYIDAGVACSILFIYPILVALIMILFFGERASWFTFLCLALATAGIALLYHGGNEGVLDWRGLVLVIVSSLCYAVYIVGVAFRRINHYGSAKLTFWVLVGGALLFFCLTGFGTRLQAVPAVWSGWLNVIGIALLPTIVPILFINIAIRCIGPTKSAILGALEPVTALVIGIGIFGEQLTWRIVLGCVLILGAVIAIISHRGN